MPRVALPLLIVSSLLVGCSSVSPFSTLTKLDLTLTATEQVNPDLHGRPSPVVVHLLELKHPVAFEHADFLVFMGVPSRRCPKTG